MKTLYLITLVIRIENDRFVYVCMVMEMINHLILILLSNLALKTICLPQI